VVAFTVVGLERRKAMGSGDSGVSCGTRAALIRTVTHSTGIRTASRWSFGVGVQCIWTVWFWILGEPEEMG
jgi:hypothetical protein